jgi:hypothetical protein
MNSIRGSARIPATLSVLALGGCAVATFRTRCLEQDAGDTTQEEVDPTIRIPVDFCDRLAAKPYLQPVPGMDSRPPAVPQTLRLLMVDLPDVRLGGLSGGSCHYIRGFEDGVAPPASIINDIPVSRSSSSDQDKDDSKRKKTHQTLEIEQKVWVKSFYQCRGDTNTKVGVELMEANTKALNPQNLRRRISFLQHDPKKYTPSEHDAKDRVAATPVDAWSGHEEDAPWNQHAWTEEVILRISGQVPFAQPLERAGRWARLLLGDTYYHHRRWGVVETTTSANKPHAVIANGAALQCVPNALRLLQKACKDHDVPLYVIRDTRKWGGNTHNNLGEVVQDLRRTVKRRIVTASLQHSAGRPFQMGRLLGKVETEAKWQAKEAARKASELLKEAERVKKQRREQDWSQLDGGALEKQFVRHGVVLRKTAPGEDSEHRNYYSNGLVELARRCVGEERKLEEEELSSELDEGEEEETPTE